MILVIALSSSRAQAMRVALIVGNNVGNEHDDTLRYAETDAERMSGLFLRLAGFDSENTSLLKGRTVADVRSAFAAITAKLRATPGQHLFLFYYSGHADGQALHLGGETLPFAELKSLALALPVGVRVVIVDACQSGALARMKGGQPWVTFEVDAADPARGLAILASSRDSELSQESDDLRGSFFTHHLYAGLSGMADRDRDGRVSLNEAFDYASEQTLNATAETWAGPQHPTFRFDLTGHEDVILTYPGRPGGGYGRLSFNRAGWYFIRRARGSILAEIHSRGGEQIALEQGRYEVERRGREHLELAVADVASGTVTEISGLPTRQVAFGRAVRKGGGLRARSYSVAAEGLVRSSLASLGTSTGGTVAARIDAAPGSLELRLALVRATHTTFVPSATWDASLAAAALRFRDFRVVTLAAGVEAGWNVFHQRAAVAPAVMVVQAPSLGPTALLELPLWRRFCLRADLSLPIYVLPLEVDRGERLSVAVGVRAGLGVGGYF
jgi:hypothetical protein